MTLVAASGAGDFIKSIVTSDIDHLASIQKGKNRRYTQIKPGSKTVLTCPTAFRQYLYVLQRTLTLMEAYPVLGSYAQVCRSLNEAILRAALGSLTPTLGDQEKVSPFSARRKGVRKALDYLHVHSSLMPTITELCHEAGLSERSLQYGFKEYMGISPVRYLRLVRLNEARRELMALGKKRIKVMDVALNWGFVEMGRFSGEYRQLFQELPSETLKASRNR